MSGPEPLFDRALGTARANRKRKAEPNILTRTIAEELADRLAFVNRRFERALVIAPEPEAIASLCGTVKIQSAGLLKMKQAAKKGKK